MASPNLKIFPHNIAIQQNFEDPKKFYATYLHFQLHHYSINSRTWFIDQLNSILDQFRTTDTDNFLLTPPECSNRLVTIFV